MRERQIDTIRRRLLAKQAEFVENSRRRCGLITEWPNGQLDEMPSAVAQDLTVQVMNSGWRIARAIERAIESLENSQYGVCRDCGDRIGSNRLAAIPWASLCIRCQETSDRDGPAFWLSARRLCVRGSRGTGRADTGGGAEESSSGAF